MSTSSSTKEVIRLGSHEATGYVKSESFYQKAFKRFLRDRLSMICAFILITMAALALAAPIIADSLGINPNRTDPINRQMPFGWEHPETGVTHILGTDSIGRDQFTRLLYAGRVSLGIGFFGATLTLIIGLTFGVITGYYGGVVDDVFNWIITTLDSIPTIYLLIIISIVLTPSAEALILAVTLTGWTGVTRIVRGQTFQIRSLDYVTSARALGASGIRIMFAHIAPNLISILVIVLMRSIGGLMLAEAALSFLNFGVQPPTPTWGNMLTGAQEFIVSPNGIYLLLPPGLCIWVAVLCLYVMGDGLRDAFDPAAAK